MISLTALILGLVLAGEPTTFATQDVSFKPGGRMSPLSLVQKERQWAVPFPKGLITWGGDNEVTILGGGAPVKAPATIPMSVVVSPDGARAAILQGGNALTIVSTATGKVEWQRPQGRECAAAFVANDVVVFHDDKEGRLWRMKLPATAPPVALGPERPADSCWAVSGGRRFITRGWKSTTLVEAVDVETGLATPVVPNAGIPVVASPDGERVCYFEDKALLCKRLSDGGVERLSPKAQDDELVIRFDDTGRRLMFMSWFPRKNAALPDEPVVSVADFASQKVLLLHGIVIHTGGVLALSSGGELVASGSNSGVEVFDLVTRKKTKLAGKSLYGVAAVAGRPTALLVEQEHPSGTEQDLFRTELVRGK